MPKCPQCGIERESLASPCMICGHAVAALSVSPPKRVCLSCGTGVAENAVQCPLCLKHIDHSDRKKNDAGSAEAINKTIGKTTFWMTIYACLILAYFALDAVFCCTGGTGRSNKDKHGDVAVTTGHVANDTLPEGVREITDKEELKRVNALLDAPLPEEVTKQGGMASDTRTNNTYPGMTGSNPIDLSKWVYSFVSRCLFGISLILLARGIRMRPYQAAKLLCFTFWLLMLRVFVILPLNRDILGHNLFDEFLLNSNIQPSGAAGMGPLFLITVNVWKSWRKTKRLQANAAAQDAQNKPNHAQTISQQTALTGVTGKTHYFRQTQPNGTEKMMNSACRKILGAYIATLAIMLLFPPMVLQISRGNSIAYKFQFIGSIGSRPDNWGVLEMNFKQLAIQIVIVSLMAAAGCLVAKDKKD